jgi:modulator of FtsH protease HflC
VNRLTRIVVIAVVVLVFLAFLTTYTVRFNEQAIVTTFGKAGSDSVRTEPGLHFKWPFDFIQSVTKYDTRKRLIESDQETQQTRDGSQILLRTYLTYRIDDPLKFYQLFSSVGTGEREHYGEADRLLKTKLRAASGEVSKFSMEELLSTDRAASKIKELEGQMLAALNKAGTDKSIEEYGIKAVSIGVSGIGLPQATSTAVFNRMKAARLKIANEAISQGNTLADTIKANADADAKKITAFAEQLATRIRNQGDIEAAKYIAQLREDPELAVFIQNMQFIRTVVGKRITLVLPTTLPGLELMRPDALKNLKAGELPVPKSFELEPTPSAPGTPDAPAKPRTSATPGASEASSRDLAEGTR